MTASTTIGEYKVEYDRMGKPTFYADGKPVPYAELKGNTLAQANDYFKLISGKTQDGQTENLSQSLSKKDRIQGEMLLKDAGSRDVPPQSMSKINDYISSLDNMGKEQIRGLKEKLNHVSKQVSKVVQKTTQNISSIIKKDKQY